MTIAARILVVEDDPADARLVLDALADLDLAPETLVVNDGVEAMEYLHSRGRYRQRPPGQPAVVLLDVKMPRLSGLEVLRHIRSDPLLRAIPVVMLTASREERDLRGAYELGANGYIVKAIDFDACTASLRAAAQFWALANEPPSGCLGRPAPEVRP